MAMSANKGVIRKGSGLQTTPTKGAGKGGGSGKRKKVPSSDE